MKETEDYRHYFNSSYAPDKRRGALMGLVVSVLF